MSAPNWPVSRKARELRAATHHMLQKVADAEHFRHLAYGGFWMPRSHCPQAVRSVVPTWLASRRLSTVECLTRLADGMCASTLRRIPEVVWPWRHSGQSRLHKCPVLQADSRRYADVMRAKNICDTPILSFSKQAIVALVWTSPCTGRHAWAMVSLLSLSISPIAGRRGSSPRLQVPGAP